MPPAHVTKLDGVEVGTITRYEVHQSASPRIYLYLKYKSGLHIFRTPQRCTV